MKMKDWIEHLETYDPDTEVVPVFWQAGDIECRAKAMGLALTEEEIRKTVQRIGDDHDAEFGINWEIIGYYLDEYIIRQTHEALAAASCGEKEKPEIPF